MIYDIWYMIYDVWYMIYDIWYMICWWKICWYVDMLMEDAKGSPTRSTLKEGQKGQKGFKGPLIWNHDFHYVYNVNWIQKGQKGFEGPLIWNHDFDYVYNAKWTIYPHMGGFGVHFGVLPRRTNGVPWGARGGGLGEGPGPGGCPRANPGNIPKSTKPNKTWCFLKL